jgi:hypothetical protein
MRNKNTRVLPSIVILLGLMIFLAVHGTLPSRVLPKNAPASEFSAGRAMQDIEIITLEPRPAGTEGNLRAQNTILERLTQMGLEPVIQSTTACGHFPKAWCASPKNILARIEGTDPTNAILLAAHYDSQQNCPCASDDASGVAVLLETARAILSGPPLKNSVILLFSDAHEWNFQGAAAFVIQHPWAQQVRLVFCYDAGTSGGPASLMVYDPQSTWIIDELAHIGEYPFTNSALQYFRDHPGGDLNAFQAYGYSGFESGYWTSAYYHSSLDTFANFKPASLQQQGTVAVEMVRHFGELDLTGRRESFLVYFNLLRLCLVKYPVSWVLPITGFTLAGFMALLYIGLKRQRLTWSGMGWSLLAFLLCLTVPALIVWLLSSVIPLINPLYKTGYTANLEGLVYNQPWLAVAFTAVGLALGTTSYNFLAHPGKANLADRMMGTLAVLVTGLVSISFAAPGASYLLAWPLLFSLIAPACWFLKKDGMDKPVSILPLLGIMIAGSAAILLQVPMIMAAYIVSSLAQSYIPTILLTITLGFLGPCVYMLTERRRWWLPILAGVTALGILIPILLDGFDAKKPQYFDLFYVLNVEQKKALWATSTTPDEKLFSSLFPLGAEGRRIPGFIIKSPLEVANAPLATLPAPNIEVIEDTVTSDIRTMHLRFSSRRNATILYVTVTNPGLTFRSVSVNGIVSAKPLSQRQLDKAKLILPEGVSASDMLQNRTLFYFEGLGREETIDVVLKVDIGEPVDLIVIDSSFGLPSFSSSILDLLPSGILPGHTETTVYTAVSLGDGR